MGTRDYKITKVINVHFIFFCLVRLQVERLMVFGTVMHLEQFPLIIGHSKLVIPAEYIFWYAV